MSTRTWLFPVVVVSALLGCDEPKPTTTESSAKPAVTAKATASATVAAASAKPAGSAKAGHMINCPNAVDGASTEFVDTKDGVDVVVKGKDEAATKEIRARAATLVAASKSDTGPSKHTGSGEGGGQFGRCPVVMKNTTVETADVDGGAKISVKAKDAKEIDWLRREAKERLAELGEPGAKDAGQRKMAHCPSSVDGASTEVKETKDAVEVSVTAKDEAKTKEIRERAKHVAEVAKLDPKSVDHTGEGKGGGGLGRCPAVVRDTTIEVKEVAGGVLLVVKPAKAADLAALAKETKERAALFAPGAAPASASAAPAAGSAAAGKKP